MLFNKYYIVTMFDLMLRVLRALIYLYIFTFDKAGAISLAYLDFILCFYKIYYRLNKIKNPEYLLDYLKYYYSNI